MLLPVPERTGAPARYTGRGVVIAFVDSGFYPHADLAGRIRLYVDATTRTIRTRGLPPANADNLNWHGQMTSVIAAGDGRTSGGRYRGIASGASLVLIKVSNRRNQIKEADILRGLKWLAVYGRKHHVRVVNVSVGGDHPDDDPDHPLHATVADLTAQGMTVLIAAGNGGSPHVVPPASAAHAITVGGYDDRNSLDVVRWQPFHSSYGPAHDGTQKPDIIAPAAWLASPILPGSIMAREARWLVPMLALTPDEQYAFMLLLRTGLRDFSFIDSLRGFSDEALRRRVQARIDEHKLVDEHHQHVDGTSVAAPIAASVVAQLLEANPRLTPADIKHILTSTARRMPGVPLERQGAGVIDAAGALAAV